MGRTKREKLIQGISLVYGVNKEEAEIEAKKTEEIKRIASIAENWAKLEKGTEAKVLELAIIAKILTKYKKEERDKLIRILHKVIVIDISKCIKTAETMKKMGEIERT